MTPRPTSVDPVKPIFATSGCSTRRAPTTDPLPTSDVQHALRDPGLERELREPERRERRQLGRLEHDGVAARERGPSFQDAMLSGKFQGTISPTTPSGSRNVKSTPPATGIVSP